MATRPPIYLYTDGAASGNPGPGGYGVVLRCGDRCRELSGGFAFTTNNRMELLAVIAGLEQTLGRRRSLCLQRLDLCRGHGHEELEAQEEPRPLGPLRQPRPEVQAGVPLDQGTCRASGERTLRPSRRRGVLEAGPARRQWIQTGIITDTTVVIKICRTAKLQWESPRAIPTE